MGLKKALDNSNFRSILADSWAVSWPMTLIMLLIFIIGICDVYIAGRFGKEIQAAYGLAFQIYFIFGVIASALTVGAVSVIAQLFTSGKKEACRSAIDSSIIMAALTGCACVVVALVSGRFIINIFNAPDSLKEGAGTLISIYAMGLPFNYLLMNSNGVLRACGMIRKSLGTMVFVCVANVVLIFILALHTPLGFRGIGIATVISTAFGALMNFMYMRPLISGKMKLSPEVMRTIFTIGWPAGVLQILWQVGSMALFYIVSMLPQDNVEIMAALTNGLRIESAIFLPAFAFNMANAVVVGNLLGRKKYSDAFSGGIVTALSGVVLVSMMTVIILLNARNISAVLSQNPIVVRQCVTYIYISLILEPIMAWGVILGGGLNGAGDTRSVMVIIACSVWLVRIPLSYLLGVRCAMGASAIWWSMNISIIIQSLFISHRYFAGDWLRSIEHAGQKE